ncbi:MAG: single-stranded DNA-binding protein [Acidimicrobiales bacterium]|jgi:single-stranded DNA-binding protein|nr:single-stranded DNA-binding protein [Acidimicrobiales bacterium]MDP6760262.1 single-stranded DNA-binding protein [Acidimicrobiales bacterium]|tara:strand:+ start:1943 stop:2365 length:423 start_codon:yes stop_codon:yes gene_type:complete
MAANEVSMSESGLSDTNLSDTNLCVLVGELSSDPRPLELESGSLLLRCEVTVRAGGATDSVPVVRFGPMASERSLSAGDRVAVVGRVHRRFFRAGGTTVSRTEVVADRVVPVRNGVRASRLFESARTRLGTTLPVGVAAT